MALYLGLDTSNYTTSAAVYESKGHCFRNCGELLPVPDGQLGLRQSDAVFAHLKALPTIVEGLNSFQLKEIAAVGVSAYPRRVNGSYMPCFLAGLTMAKVIANILRVPCYEFSHQEGHLAAVLFAKQRQDLMEMPYLAWHLSGGTTELLHVSQGMKIEKIGGTSDISAGQLIDRTGAYLGISFPAGRAIDSLSQNSGNNEFFKIKLNDLTFSLSGMENKVKSKIGNEPPEDIASFVLKTLGALLVRTTDAAMKKYGEIPVVVSGGVACNTYLRDALKQFDAIFALPEYSSDNSLGIAALASIEHEKEN